MDLLFFIRLGLRSKRTATDPEIIFLNRLALAPELEKPSTLDCYMKKIARLDGYLDRKMIRHPAQRHCGGA